MANSVTTNLFREKLATAQATGVAISAVTKIAFGDGGHDVSTGEATPPDPDATIVSGELLKKDIKEYNFINTKTIEFVGEILSAELDGEVISSFGLYDSDGDLVAIKHTTPKPKSTGVKFVVNFKQEF